MISECLQRLHGFAGLACLPSQRGAGVELLLVDGGVVARRRPGCADALLMRGPRAIPQPQNNQQPTDEKPAAGIEPAHASTWMPSCVPASVIVMTRFTGFSGMRVETWIHCLPLTPSRISWPIPSTDTSGASSLAIWYGVP